MSGGEPDGKILKMWRELEVVFGDMEDALQEAYVKGGKAWGKVKITIGEFSKGSSSYPVKLTMEQLRGERKDELMNEVMNEAIEKYKQRYQSETLTELEGGKSRTKEMLDVIIDWHALEAKERAENAANDLNYDLVELASERNKAHSQQYPDATPPTGAYKIWGAREDKLKEAAKKSKQQAEDASVENFLHRINLVINCLGASDFTEKKTEVLSEIKEFRPKTTVTEGQTPEDQESLSSYVKDKELQDLILDKVISEGDRYTKSHAALDSKCLRAVHDYLEELFYDDKFLEARSFLTIPQILVDFLVRFKGNYNKPLVSQKLDSFLKLVVHRKKKRAAIKSEIGPVLKKLDTTDFYKDWSLERLLGCMIAVNFIPQEAYKTLLAPEGKGPEEPLKEISKKFFDNWSLFKPLYPGKHQIVSMIMPGNADKAWRRLKGILPPGKWTAIFGIISLIVGVILIIGWWNIAGGLLAVIGATKYAGERRIKSAEEDLQETQGIGQVAAQNVVIQGDIRSKPGSIYVNPVKSVASIGNGKWLLTVPDECKVGFELSFAIKSTTYYAKVPDNWEKGRKIQVSIQP